MVKFFAVFALVLTACTNGVMDGTSLDTPQGAAEPELCVPNGNDGGAWEMATDAGCPDGSTALPVGH